MVDRATKLRWRRKIRKSRRQVEEISAKSEQNIEKYFFRRLQRLRGVWKFTTFWILFMLMLGAGTVLQTRAQNNYFQVLKPVEGGTFTEGMLGTFTSANPIYATSSVDSSVAKLIFSGLMRYDSKNRLTTDLAEKITIDESGKVYTVNLRKDIFWHDGQPLTSKDVMFTYGIIKNPDARSPLFSVWKDVTVKAKDKYVVEFELPNTLSTFEEALTNGIVPEHILSGVNPEQMRTDKFNTINPIGSGPFKWSDLEVVGTTQESRQEVIGLLPNDRFYRTAPKLGHFVLRTYKTEQQMVRSFSAGELTSMVGLSNVPDEVRDVADVHEFRIPLTGAVMVFFKNTTPPLDDVKVRRALVQSVEVSRAIDKLDYKAARVKGPLLKSQVGYSEELTQLTADIDQAEKYLDEAGWVKSNDGMRYKEGKRLTFSLYAQNTSDYSAITSYLQKAWKNIGVDAKVTLQNDSEMQGVVSRHDYDALLYGISLGTDPDVFPYWHSSQADAGTSARLNLSEYSSKPADESLQAGRTRLDPSVRSVKYEPFLKAWRDDAPALALYQPNFLYVTRGEVYNFNPTIINRSTNRFANVEKWMIRQKRINR